MLGLKVTVGGNMGKYNKGDHVKIEVVNEHTGESEWMWLLVESSDDHDRLVFGKLDTQPIIVTDMHLGQELAASYDTSESIAGLTSSR